MTEHISGNLRALRTLRHFTQEEVAERVGVSRQAAAKWESGETLPDLRSCAALAELYGVTLDSLIYHDAEAAGTIVPPKDKHMFGTVTVGERGQIVIPKKARELFGIQPGDSLMVLGDEALGTRGLALVDPQLFFAQMETLRRAAGGKGGESR